MLAIRIVPSSAARYPLQSVGLSTTRRYHSSLTSKVGRLILVRHGQSFWNVTDPSLNLTTRFTGWADIGLTEKGREQARAAGRAIRSSFSDLNIDCAACSLLGRSQETMDIVLDELGLVVDHNQQQPNSSNNKTSFSSRLHYSIPIITSWRLNERHYGALVGLSKAGAEVTYGKSIVSQWRHGWDVRPPPMDKETRREWARHAHCRPLTLVRDPKLTQEPDGDSDHNNTKAIHTRHVRILEKTNSQGSAQMPASESLQDTCERVMPFWNLCLAPRLIRGETVLVVAHSNTVKAMLRIIDPTVVTTDSFNRLKIPSAMPLVYYFSDSKGAETNDSVIPGGLVVLPSPPLVVAEKETLREEESNLRYELHGQWIETSAINEMSFCTPEGESHLEHEIA